MQSQLQAKIAAKATLAKATSRSMTVVGDTVWDRLATCESGITGQSIQATAFTVVCSLTSVLGEAIKGMLVQT